MEEFQAFLPNDLILILTYIDILLYRLNFRVQFYILI